MVVTSTRAWIPTLEPWIPVQRCPAGLVRRIGRYYWLNTHESTWVEKYVEYLHSRFHFSSLHTCHAMKTMNLNFSNFKGPQCWVMCPL